MSFMVTSMLHFLGWVVNCNAAKKIHLLVINDLHYPPTLKKMQINFVVNFYIL